MVTSLQQIRGVAFTPEQIQELLGEFDKGFSDDATLDGKLTNEKWYSRAVKFFFKKSVICLIEIIDSGRSAFHSNTCQRPSQILKSTLTPEDLNKLVS